LHIPRHFSAREENGKRETSSKIVKREKEGKKGKKKEEDALRTGFFPLLLSNYPANRQR